MKNELKSLLPALALVATTAIGFGQEKPTPIPPESGGFGRSGQSVNKSTVVTQNNKRGPREIRAYSASVAPFNERAAKTMIIRSSPADQKANDQLQEDIAVMYRILQKAVGDHSRDEKILMGVPFSLPGARTLYLQDYGLVFTFNVDMPLVAEPKAEKKVAEDADDTNEEWEEARNDLFGQKHFMKGGHKPSRPFDAGEVEELKQGVIEALRNASNIRNLKPNDWITVVIRGKRFDTAVWPAEGDKFRFEVDNNVIYNSDEMGSESTMVLRVKKSDVDDIAKKKGEKGSLKDKVTVTTY